MHYFYVNYTQANSDDESAKTIILFYFTYTI